MKSMSKEHLDGILASPAKKGELFEWTWQHTEIGMAFVGLKGDWLHVNGSVCKMLGYAETELLNGMTWMDVTVPGDVAADTAEVERLVRGERDEYVMRKRYIPKYGEPFWADLTVRPYILDGEECLFFLSQIQERRPPVQQVQLVSRVDEDDPDRQDRDARALTGVVLWVIRNWKVIAVLALIIAGYEIREVVGMLMGRE